MHAKETNSNLRTKEEGRPEERICQRCGFCCDGTLFTNVALQRGDKSENLAGRGLDLVCEGGRTFFLQPCKAFDPRNGCCSIYKKRPVYCRKFECGILMRVKKGNMTEVKAISTIQDYKRRLNRIKTSLERLGVEPRKAPLRERVVALMETPWDLGSGRKEMQYRRRTQRAAEELMLDLENEFLA